MTMVSLASDFVEFVRDKYSTTGHIPLHAPKFDSTDEEYVADTLKTTFVSTVGHYVNQFEKAISKYTGASYVVATVNGTSALHTALLCIGLEQGEEVITTPLTFVATCNAIRYCGAEPVFVDVDRTTLGLSPDSLEEFLGKNVEVRDDQLCWNKKTGRVVRACVPVHNLGHPVRIKDIHRICQEYNIVLVEDAAESLGSFFQNQHTGLIGRVGIVSFNGNKIITTGGGGALITNDQVLADNARHKTTTAKRTHPWLYIHDEVGYNYRLPNLNAALGCAQMSKLDRFLESKRSLADAYADWFSDREEEFVREPKHAMSNYWLNAIMLRSIEERDEFLRITNDNLVMTRPMWTPMNTLPMYNSCQSWCLENAIGIEQKLVKIPSSVV